VTVNVGADEKVKLVGGDGAEISNPKNRMLLTGTSSLATPRVPSATRAMLERAGGPTGAVDDMVTDAAAITPPALCAGKPTIADVPVATPAGGVSVGSVTAEASGTDATTAADVNAARL
jgi:hypothetical protein